MALETLAKWFGRGGAAVHGQQDGSLFAIIRELQGLSFDRVDGASADTNIAVSGIATDDTIAFVLGLDPDNGTPGDQVQDFTSNTSITSSGNIQTDVDTSGFDLVVIWWNKDNA